MLDLDNLLRSLGEDAPSGEDLEYDAGFTDLEMANQPGEERVIGDAVIPAEDPDYDLVARLAIDLLGRTRDLRVSVILANAALHTDGLPAFEEVLRYIRRSLEEYWDSVHPQLDADEDDDPTMRVNAILGLADRDSVLRSLRLAPLTDSRAFGRFSLRDLQAAEGDITPASDMEAAPNKQSISAAFEDTDMDRLADTKTAATAILDHVKAISEIFDERIGALGPELEPLQKMAYDIGRQLTTYAGSATTEDTDDAPSPDAPEADVPVAAPGQHVVGAINGPDDVVKGIDRIMAYYARNEPSSPLPILLNRARRLVSADFVTIMKDMAPQGVENVAHIGGLEEDTD